MIDGIILAIIMSKLINQAAFIIKPIGLFLEPAYGGNLKNER